MCAAFWTFGEYLGIFAVQKMNRSLVENTYNYWFETGLSSCCFPEWEGKGHSLFHADMVNYQGYVQNQRFIAIKNW